MAQSQELNNKRRLITTETEACNFSPRSSLKTKTDDPHHSEAEIVTAGAQLVPELVVGRAEFQRTAAPGAAANASHIVFGILAPLPDVAVHLIQAARVRLEGFDRNRALAIVAFFLIAP